MISVEDYPFNKELLVGKKAYLCCTCPICLSYKFGGVKHPVKIIKIEQEQITIEYLVTGNQEIINLGQENDLIALMVKS
jgi:hypothetical protein